MVLLKDGSLNVEGNRLDRGSLGTRVRRQRQRGSIPRPSAKMLSPVDWLASPEGRATVREALERIDRSERELAAARQISFEDLYGPKY